MMIEEDCTLEGCQKTSWAAGARHSSPFLKSEQVLGVVPDPMLFQQPLQFVFEALLAMMFFLSLDVVGHIIERPGAYRKDRIAVLPVKLLPWDLCDPSRPAFLSSRTKSEMRWTGLSPMSR